MAKSKKMKLTTAQINQEDNKYNKLIKVPFDNGMYTEIYQYLRPTKIEAMLEDFSAFLVNYEGTGNLIREKESDLYLKLHIVQHFSTLVEEYPKDFHEKMDIFNKMADNDVVKKVFESFDQNELAKVYEIIAAKFEQYQKLINQNDEVKEQLRMKIEGMNLENKDLILSTMFADDANG